MTSYSTKYFNGAKLPRIISRQLKSGKIDKKKCANNCPWSDVTVSDFYIYGKESVINGKESVINGKESVTTGKIHKKSGKFQM